MPYRILSSSWRLHSSLWLPSPRERVFELFSDARGLERLTPDHLHLQIEGDASVPMAEGLEVVYRLRLFGVPVRWSSLIETFDPPHRFVDVQLRGPYLAWRHEHGFLEEDGGTTCTDTIEFRVPGPTPVARLVVLPQVRRLFAHRAEVLAREFGAPGDRSPRFDGVRVEAVPSG